MHLSIHRKEGWKHIPRVNSGYLQVVELQVVLTCLACCFSTMNMYCFGPIFRPLGIGDRMGQLSTMKEVKKW